MEKRSKYISWQLLLLFLLSITVYSCSQNSNNSDEVMICLSEDAYAYHDSQCYGLDQCDADIEYLDQEEAEGLGRTPCGFCY